jgi:subtilisin family serine protease
MWFEFPVSSFTSYQAAHTHFSGMSNVEEAKPNEVYGVYLEYAQSGPGDYWYQQNNCLHIQALGINSTSRVDIGPPYGSPLSSVSVAVIDTGVLRSHPDFNVLNSSNRKISSVGVSCENKTLWFGNGYGHVTWTDTDENRLVRHGTSVSGTICATTNDASHTGSSTGVAACAPECAVLPIAGKMTSNRTMSDASLAMAFSFMKEAFKYGNFTENIRVVNMSFGRDQQIGFWQKMIIRDLKDSDRLYVGSAGNLHSEPADEGNTLVYPAAWPEVLGVSGGWVYYNTSNNSTTWYSRDNLNNGSNYRLDANQGALLRAYPVSAVYGTVNNIQGETLWTRTTSTQISGDGPATLYSSFSGTSFAAAQVSSLAALLYDADPSRTRAWVKNRIINKRNTTVEAGSNFSQYQLAGPIQVDLTLGPTP